MTVSIPIFVVLILFADPLIRAWVGSGYETSAYILRILALGVLINMIFAAPGNSITPNVGYPRIVMIGGIIFLVINLISSFLLVRHYGILGAAYGNTLSTIVSSFYNYFASVKYFGKSKVQVLLKMYVKPFLALIIAGIISYGCYILIAYLLPLSNRIQNIFCAVLCSGLFGIIYIIILHVSKYFTERDKSVFSKLLYTAIPINRFRNAGNQVNP